MFSKAPSRVFSREEVAAHNQPGDSWVSINGRVYDVSAYSREHPGGRTPLMQFAGKDASGAFNTLHAGEVLTQVASKFQIGTLRAEAPAPSANSAVALEAASQTLDAVSSMRELLSRQRDTAIAAASAPLAASAFSLAPPAHGSESARSMDAERLDAHALRALPNLASIQAAAERLMPSSLRLYIGYGAEDEETVSANTSAWSEWSLRPRVLTASGPPSTACTVLGCELAAPILIAPFAGAKACHPDGEDALARAAGRCGSGLVVPHYGGVPLESVSASFTESRKSVEQRGQPPQGGPPPQRGPPLPLFFQLYPPRMPSGALDREYTSRALRHAEEMGCHAVFVTVDTSVDGNRERTYRSEEWLASLAQQLGSMPAVVTLRGSGLGRHPGMATRVSWEDIDWMRTRTGMKVVVKGIMTGEDAAMAAEHCDAIVVSNHGGRQLDGCGATADVLRECVHAADGRIEVLVDGGVRRGKDVFRALALGASGVLIGRPSAYGLAAGGEDGVRRVLDLLKEELLTVMQLCGCASVSAVGDTHVQRRPPSRVARAPRGPLAD